MERIILICFLLISSLSFSQITLQPTQIDKINSDYFLLEKYKKLNDLNQKEIAEKDKVIKSLDLDVQKLNADLKKQSNKTEVQRKQKTTFIIISAILGGFVAFDKMKK